MTFRRAFDNPGSPALSVATREWNQGFHGFHGFLGTEGNEGNEEEIRLRFLRFLLLEFFSECGADGEFSIREIREIRGSIPLVAAVRAGSSRLCVEMCGEASQ